MAVRIFKGLPADVEQGINDMATSAPAGTVRNTTLIPLATANPDDVAILMVYADVPDQTQQGRPPAIVVPRPAQRGELN